jgi:AAA+ superfamily predicted ATPase
MNSKKATDLLRTAIRARTPVIAVESSEEARIIALIKGMASEPTLSLTGDTIVEARTVFVWTVTKGLVLAQGTDEMENPFVEPSQDPTAAILDFVKYVSGDGDIDTIRERASILVMCDPHRFLNRAEDGGQGDVVLMRALRDMAQALRKTSSVAVLLAPRFGGLGDADREVYKLDWPLPTVEELTCMVRKAGQRLEARGLPVALNGDAEVLGRALAGLTETEATRVLSLAIMDAHELSVAACGPIIVRHKADVLEAQQGVELIEPLETLNDVGGLDLLKAEVSRLPALLTSEARAAKVRAPRGFLFAGPPGTGKSLTAKVASGGLMPILRWEPASSKSKWVGSSTENTLAVLKAADAIDQCVLWIDEADTGLKDGTEGDSGVSDEMMGIVLTWMQERTSNVVVVMTTNHPERLRHAMMERLDSKWFVDYPGLDACRQIIKIHLRKRDLGWTEEMVETLANLAVSKTLAGRNIEQAIEAAHRTAFLAGRVITTEDIAHELAKTKGLVEQRPPEAKAIRDWCQAHCQPASSPDRQEITEVKADSFDLEI